MSRLYDPTSGIIFLDGKDIRSYEHGERTKKIGFILQEPFLFSGTLKDNILYGNDRYANSTDTQITEVLKESDLFDLVTQFDQ